MSEPVRDPVEDLRAIAFAMERELGPTYRIKAFRNAAATLADLTRDELASRATSGTLTALPGIGAATATVVEESLRGVEPAYLVKVTAAGEPAVTGPAAALRRALKGDLHTHSDWSDGGSPIEEMARTARSLGHEYVVLTDHSPRLTVANGLTASDCAISSTWSAR